MAAPGDELVLTVTLSAFLFCLAWFFLCARHRIRMNIRDACASIYSHPRGQYPEEHCLLFCTGSSTCHPLQRGIPYWQLPSNCHGICTWRRSVQICQPHVRTFFLEGNEYPEKKPIAFHEGFACIALLLQKALRREYGGSFEARSWLLCGAVLLDLNPFLLAPALREVCLNEKAWFRYGYQAREALAVQSMKGFVW